MKVRELIKLIDQFDDNAPRCDDSPKAGEVSHVLFVELTGIVSGGVNDYGNDAEITNSHSRYAGQV